MMRGTTLRIMKSIGMIIDDRIHSLCRWMNHEVFDPCWIYSIRRY